MAVRDNKKVITAKSLLLQRNVLVALAGALAQEQVGGVMGLGIEVLMQVLPLKGALAYRVEGDSLALVADDRLPRKERPWLKRLSISDDTPWFIAQRVARQVRGEATERLAEERAGLSIEPALREAGWSALAGVPVAFGRKIQGVIVVAAASIDTFDRETMRTLEAAGGLIALALSREGRAEKDSATVEDTMTMRLATVGLMAASVAEDLQGPLDALKLQFEYQEGLVRNLRALFEQEPSELVSLGELTFEMVAGLRGLRDIVYRLETSFETSEMRTLDLGKVAHQAAEMMRAHVEAHGIILEIRTDKNPLPVDGREADLRMMVVQLVLQAVNQCALADDKETRIVIAVYDEVERRVISVDTGGLAPSEIRSSAEIFDALFARGKSAHERGIGMDLAKQTVLAHNGHIEVGESDLGGTHVRVLLPPSLASLHPDDLDSHHPTFRPPKPTTPALVGGAKPVIVYVDDDDAWNQTVARFLEEYDVRSATTLTQARTLIEELTEVPHAIFCLVEMVDGRASELHAAVDPSIAERFIFVSSGIIPADEATYLFRSGSPTLIKPLSLEELTGVLSGSTMADSERNPIAQTLSAPPPQSER